MMVMRGLEGHVTIWNDEGGVCLSLLRGREPCQHLMSPWLGFEEWESGNRSRTDWRGEPAGRAAFLKADVKSEVAAFRTEITPQQEKSLDGISCQWKGAGREKGQSQRSRCDHGSRRQSSVTDGFDLGGGDHELQKRVTSRS